MTSGVHPAYRRSALPESCPRLPRRIDDQQSAKVLRVLLTERDERNAEHMAGKTAAIPPLRPGPVTAPQLTPAGILPSRSRNSGSVATITGLSLCFAETG